MRVNATHRNARFSCIGVFLLRREICRGEDNHCSALGSVLDLNSSLLLVARSSHSLPPKSFLIPISLALQTRTLAFACALGGENSADNLSTRAK